MLRLTLVVGALLSSGIAQQFSGQQYSGQQQFSGQPQFSGQQQYSGQQQFSGQQQYSGQQQFSGHHYVSTTPVPVHYHEDVYNRDYSINPNSNLHFNFQQLRSDQPPQIEERVEALGKYLYTRPKTTPPPPLPPVHYPTRSNFEEPQYSGVVHSTPRSVPVPVHIPEGPQLSNINEAEILSQVTGRNHWNGNNQFYNPVHHQPTQAPIVPQWSNPQVRKSVPRQNSVRRRVRPTTKFVPITSPLEPLGDVSQYDNDDVVINLETTPPTTTSENYEYYYQAQESPKRRGQSIKTFVPTTSVPERQVENVNPNDNYQEQIEVETPRTTTPKQINRNVRIGSRRKFSRTQRPVTTAFPFTEETDEIILSQVPESTQRPHHVRGSNRGSHHRNTEQYVEPPTSPRAPPPPGPTLSPWDGDNFGK